MAKVGTWQRGRLLPMILVMVLPSCHSKVQPLAFDGAGQPGTVDRIAHGDRLTRVLGCRGCHGADLQGQKWDDDPSEYGVMWASNLTRAVPLMSNVQLEALLRHGVHPVRKDLWVMPSQMFQHLSAPDVAALLALLRTLPPAGALSPPPVQGPRALAEIANGIGKPAATLVREFKGVLPADAGPGHALGRYIASVTCAECHGMTLEGDRSGSDVTPNLIAAAAYSSQEFDHFIRTGETPGGRPINHLMVQVAKSRFSYLTARERQALYGYLQARAELPQ